MLQIRFLVAQLGSLLRQRGDLRLDAIQLRLQLNDSGAVARGHDDGTFLLGRYTRLQVLNHALLALDVRMVLAVALAQLREGRPLGSELPLGV